MFSKTRAARILGRCHAALGQHELSASALDAGLKEAKVGELLFSESLVVRVRALVGKAHAHESDSDSGGPHWPERTGKQRLREVMNRMQGDPRALAKLLLHGMD